MERTQDGAEYQASASSEQDPCYQQPFNVRDLASFRKNPSHLITASISFSTLWPQL
jgi:hypothetical protein